MCGSVIVGMCYMHGYVVMCVFIYEYYMCTMCVCVYLGVLLCEVHACVGIYTHIKCLHVWVCVLSVCMFLCVYSYVGVHVWVCAHVAYTCSLHV